MEMLVADAEKAEQSSEKQDKLTWEYDSVMVDYVVKLTIATVIFFSSFPWAALFWPPYYWRRND